MIQFCLLRVVGGILCGGNGRRLRRGLFFLLSFFFDDFERGYDGAGCWLVGLVG